MRRVTRANSTIPITVNAATSRLIKKLKKNEVIALGDHVKWPNANGKASVQVDMSFEITKKVTTAALTSRRLRFAKLGGSMLANGGAADAARHTEIVFLIAELLPRSKLLCLNMGEWKLASDDSYKALTRSLKHTYIGNMYWEKKAMLLHCTSPKLGIISERTGKRIFLNASRLERRTGSSQ
jgi:hypothetical protein